MKYQKDQVLSLGENQYRILKFIASGTIWDVYLALPVGLPESEVIIKQGRDEASLAQISGWQREIEVLTLLNKAEDPEWPVALLARLERARATAGKRRVIALLDSGEGSSGPFLVLEQVPPAFEPFAVKGVADEVRVLAVAQAIAETMKQVHRHGMSLKDWAPQGKWDWLRLRWLSEGDDFELKLIDWANSGGSDGVPQDLFFFGRHLYHLLLGRPLLLEGDGQPPARLGLGIAEWEQITLGSRQLLERLLHRAPSQRYQDASELEADLTWWLSTLRLACSPQASKRLQDRVWQARAQNRHERILALSELALGLDVSVTARQEFEMWAKQAKEELEKAIWLPIAHAQATLLTGDYQKASQEFQEALSFLPPDSPTARMARLFALLARAGSHLKSASGGSDIRGLPEWQALSRAVDALREQNWSQGEKELLQAKQLRPEVASWAPVTALLNLARAGLKVEEAAELMTRSGLLGNERGLPTVAATHPLIPSQEGSSGLHSPLERGLRGVLPLSFEAEQVALLGKAVSLLREGQHLAPEELEFTEQLKDAERRYDQRQKRLIQYQEVDHLSNEADKLLEQAGQAQTIEQDYQAAADAYQKARASLAAALEALNSMLKQEPKHSRAQLLHQRLVRRYQRAKRQADNAVRLAQKEQQVAALFEQAKASIGEADYSRAMALARQALTLLPERQALAELLEWAQAGDRLAGQAQEYLEITAQYLHLRNLDEAEKRLQPILDWRHKPLASLPGGASLSPMVAAHPFRLPKKLDERTDTLLTQLQLAHDVRTLVGEAQSRGDDEAVIKELERLESQLSLTKEESRWLRHAQSQRQKVALAQQLIDSADGFDDLRQAVVLLSDHSSEKARMLREQLRDKWLVLTKKVTNLAALHALLKEALGQLGDSHHSRFTEMLALVTQAQELLQALQPDGQRGWAAWFDDHDERRRGLIRLEEALNRLMGEQSWPFLRQQAADWKQEVLAMLAHYLRHQQRPTAQRSRTYQCQSALRQSEHLWQTVPDTFGKQLPADVTQDWLSFIEALKTRTQAEETCRQLVKRLASTELSFGDAVSQLHQLSLPTHPDVPVDDLLSLRSELEAIAKIESELQQPATAHNEGKSNTPPTPSYHPAQVGQEGNGKSPLERGFRGVLSLPCRPTALDRYATFNYAQRIYQRRLLLQQPMTIQSPLISDEEAAKLRQRVGLIEKSLTLSVKQIATKLCQALQQAAERLESEPDSDLEPFLCLYWQVRWWQQVTSATDKEPEEAVGKAFSTLQSLLGRAQELLTSMSRESELNQLKQQLAILQTLNLGLARLPAPEEPTNSEQHTPNPSQEGNDLQNSPLAPSRDDKRGFRGVRLRWIGMLPPLPAGKTLDEQTPPLDQSALERWQSIMTYLQSLSTEEGVESEEEAYNAAQVDAIEKSSHDLQQQLKSLREDVWQVLTPPSETELEQFSWPDKSTPAQLAQEAQEHQKLAGALNQVYQKRENGQLIEALADLEGQLAPALLIEKLEQFSLWLLARHRQLLKRNAKQLHAVLLTTDLAGQIAEILKEQANAVERLRDFLRKVSTEETARRIRLVVLKAVDLHVADTVKKRQRQEEQKLLNIVIEATTQPFDNQPLKVDEQWRLLHEEAKARDKELTPNHSRNPLFVTIAVIFLLLVGAGIATKGLFDEQQDAERAALANALATERTIAANATAELATVITHAEALAATATAQEAVIVTGTAQAQQAAETETAQQAESRQTAEAETAQQAESTQTAEAEAQQAEIQRCSDVDLYEVTVNGDVRLSPERGTVHLIGETEPLISATWNITNSGEGQCTWNEVNLLSPSTNETITPLLLRDGNQVESVAPGESVDIMIPFSTSLEAQSIEEEWILVLNELILYGPPRQSLFLQEKDWIVLVTPTP